MSYVPGIVGALVFGIGMSQFPEFTLQYQQHLGEAVDELRIVTEEFDRAAVDQNMSREEALAAFNNSVFLGVPVYELEATFERFDNLVEDQKVLEDADAVGRFTSFLRMTDNELVQITWAGYEPALPKSPDGLVFALIGAMGGFYGGVQISGLISRRLRKTR
ncbi:MAG: hypothetical protein COA53_01085 [Rhodobacteraceae bacterium]|nr:MAG: hypothetical protein COA53_01085 [Paracoccaceae bacterium]